MKSILLTFILFLFILMGCGTLGGFDQRTFPTSKQNLVSAIDTLFAKYPQYAIPDKWKSHDDWKERGYDFLDTRIFYFSSKPEEMFYVSFIGGANDSIQKNSNSTSISIRAVDTGTAHWTLEKEFSASDKDRIQERFDKEIISKLELYTDTKSRRED